MLMVLTFIEVGSGAPDVGTLLLLGSGLLALAITGPKPTDA